MKKHGECRELLRTINFAWFAENSFRRGSTLSMENATSEHPLENCFVYSIEV